MGHRTGGIVRDGSFKAFHGLIVVEAVRPHESAIEPALGFLGAGGYGAAVGSQVKVVVVDRTHGVCDCTAQDSYAVIDQPQRASLYKYDALATVKQLRNDDTTTA